jgi:fatty acid desaturase
MNDTEPHARDHSLRQIAWRDLAVMTRWDAVREMLLPAPWLLGSLLLADRGMYPLAMALSFGFFLTGLRVVHGAFHRTLGLPRRATDCVMLVFSVAMLGSMHAVRWNHLRHHRHCLAEDDLESMGARGSALGAVLLGPRFPISLHRAALARAGKAERGWIVAELAANVAAIAMAFGMPLPGAVRYHLLAMSAGQCLTAFFAVWTVHHGCPLRHSGEELPARTVRNPFRAIITFNMFFHLEHHLFPRVPTARLHILASRIDAASSAARWKLVW